LRNEAIGIAAIDMFVVASAAFRLLFVTLILAHDCRKIVRFDVTQHPTAGWLSRQVTEAFPWDTAPRYLLRDRDTSYGLGFRNRVDAMRITEIVTAPRSPWQNFYIEKVIGSIRRECLDHIVVFNEPHLRRVRMGGPPSTKTESMVRSLAQMINRARPVKRRLAYQIAEAIGGMQRNRRGFDVKPFEEFARTTNGQHVRSDILPTPFM
jgi:hypothetical protein